MKDISILRRSGWTAGVGGKYKPRLVLFCKKHRNAPLSSNSSHTPQGHQARHSSGHRHQQGHYSDITHQGDVPRLHKAGSGAEASQKHRPNPQNSRITALQGNHFSAYPTCKRGPLAKDEG